MSVVPSQIHILFFNFVFNLTCILITTLTDLVCILFRKSSRTAACLAFKKKKFPQRGSLKKKTLKKKVLIQKLQ